VEASTAEDVLSSARTFIQRRHVVLGRLSYGACRSDGPQRGQRTMRPDQVGGLLIHPLLAQRCLLT
jgi:hypothetical protein